jgi:hypothetical protein
MLRPSWRFARVTPGGRDHRWNRGRRRLGCSGKFRSGGRRLGAPATQEHADQEKDGAPQGKTATGYQRQPYAGAAGTGRRVGQVLAALRANEIAVGRDLQVLLATGE